MIAVFSLLLTGCLFYNGDSSTPIDPPWFEKERFSNLMVTECGQAGELTVDIAFEDEGSLTDYELSWLWMNVGSGSWSGSCSISESTTPDERRWTAECDDLNDVIVYSDDFKVEFTVDIEVGDQTCINGNVVAE